MAVHVMLLYLARHHQDGFQIDAKSLLTYWLAQRQFDWATPWKTSHQFENSAKENPLMN